MKLKRKNKRKAKVQAALEKVNKNHGGTLAKLGGGSANEFRDDVDSFTGKNRGAPERLAKK